MSVRYVTQDLEWSESMKECIQLRLVEPLARHLNSSDFEISVHLNRERKPRAGQPPGVELWVVLQTFTGLGNEVVRAKGEHFHALVADLSHSLRARLRRHQEKQKLFASTLRFLSA